METEIFLIRHGQTHWNKIKRVQGHQDEPLSPEGMEQARLLGKFLRSVTFHAIYSSDLKRAVQTAEQVATGRDLSIHTSSSLRERCMGEWEGRMLEEVKEKHSDDWSTVWYMGGKYGVEAAEKIRARMLATLDHIVREHTGRRVAVISHGGSINTVLQAISGGLYGPGRNRIQNTSVSHLVHHSDTGWRVEKVNDVAHLRSEGTSI
ncbi:histidine phosphatase family protein [Melghirimyces algeriensis]|uniref:Probable phosphoglycerate mutase/uncharacterized phosphatase n=1 Tax=Melghirimyces algeriensis TaxID=910412 RepID=A0A521CM46_9BACL|nr:histidine phosphatase family protein [Melghirimyces algeriensis]SMO60518.1 probable phosphoglycerate mutase/uncharacterized phosphatase [Melghirimyces algeriensis]